MRKLQRIAFRSELKNLMEKKIYGNTDKLRKNLLEYLESFLDNIYAPGEFLPPEIEQMLVIATSETGMEFAVFLNRKNRVTAICAGSSESVSLEGFEDTRRGEKRLSGIRLWHTHPNGSSRPSDVDVSSLKSQRLDACGVIGVNTEEERATGYSVTLPLRDADGLFTESETVGPYIPGRAKYFNSLFDRLVEIDGEAADFAAHIVSEHRERAILCGVVLPEDEKLFADGSPLAELAELADTAGALVVGEFTQKRPSFDSRYYIGKGIAEDISLRRQALNATLLILDDEVSAGVAANLEELTGLRVVDRTMLILDIFAQRARSREGKLQVELAQQKYMLPRLIGLGKSLSRLGGGIGTRGPGESKLTSDRNHIRRRIAYLEEELRKVTVSRGTLRKERHKKGTPQVAVVGYTNAGKSTLVNLLCDSDIFAEDMLFATLDPSVRRLATEDNRDILLIDTVGFIRKLPTKLVEAFKSTLEELKYADLLLHVSDGSAEDIEEHRRVVNQLIDELEAGNKPCFEVINKIDKVAGGEAAGGSEALNHAGNTGGSDASVDSRAGEGDSGREGNLPEAVNFSGDLREAADFAGNLPEPVPFADKTFYVSARTGEGVPELKKAIIEFFEGDKVTCELLIPYDKGALLSYVHENGEIKAEEYTAGGVRLEAVIDKRYLKEELLAYKAK